MEFRILLLCVFALAVNSQSIDSLNDKQFEEAIEKMKADFHKIDKLIFKAQMKIVIWPEKYLTNDGKFVDKVGLQNALNDICFSMRKGIITDWIEETINENILEQMSKIPDNLIEINRFRRIIIKLNPALLFGNLAWNKVKDLTISDVNPEKKLDL